MSAQNAGALRLPPRAFPVLAGLPLAAGIGILVTRTTPHQDPVLLAELLIGLAGVVCACRWRLGVYAVLVYVTVEGFVTNALYPLTAALLFKDFLLGATYLGFLLTTWRRQETWALSTSVLWPLGALAGLCAAGAFNPSGVDPQVTLVGVRVLLFYTPLYFLGLVLARDPLMLVHLTRLVLYASLPVTLFGIFQWMVGPEFTAGLGPGFARSIWIIGPEAGPEVIYRPISTFAFVGHFGGYLLFIGILAFAALHLRMSWRERALIVPVFVCAAVAVVIEAQRTTWVLLPLAAIGTYLLVRNRRGLLRAMPVLAGGAVAAAFVGGSILSNRLPLLAGGLGIYTDRFYGTTGGAFQTADLFSLDGLIGHGTGTALGATRYVTGGNVPSAFESGWFIPFYMFGILGLVVYLWLYGAVLVEAWRGCRAFVNDERRLPAALFCFLALTAIVSGPINSPPTNVYFWLFAGVLAGRGMLARVGQEVEP